MRLAAASVVLILAAVAAPSSVAFNSVNVGRASTTTTVLQNSGMSAYDAQLRQASMGSSGGRGAATLAAPPGGSSTSGAATSAFPSMDADNFKSSPRWRKKTKQLATLGPASSSFEMIEKLFLAGADVFRLNFSHGEHAQKKELLDTIRKVEEKYDHPIAILGDLQGPKLRVGKFANPDGEVLQAGQAFRFDLDPTPGNAQRVQLPHPEIIEASRPGHELLIDDGKVKVVVTATGPGYLDCKVLVPGKIKDKKVCVCALHSVARLGKTCWS
jgi:pyruvate kinase